jgi:hypothetical protein
VHDVMAGEEVAEPPRLDQLYQPVLVGSQVLIHTAPSVPVTTTSSRVGEDETARGSDVRLPPSDCQSPHVTPPSSDERLHKPLSVPRTKRST